MNFSFTKNPESDFFYKESKSNKKKILAGGRGGNGDAARVSFWREGGEGMGMRLG